MKRWLSPQSGESTRFSGERGPRKNIKICISPHTANKNQPLYCQLNQVSYISKYTKRWLSQRGKWPRSGQ